MTAPNREDQDAAAQEYEAWKAVVAEWTRLRLPDFNGEKATPLIRAIELWGERLVALRMFAPAEDREKWAAEAQAKYDRSR